MPTKRYAKAPPSQLTSGEAMNQDVETIRPRASAQEAAVRMRAFDVGLLPVIGEGEVQGVITDRDLVIRGLAESRPLLQTTVESLMTRNPVSILTEQAVDNAVRVLELNRIRRVLVTDSEGQLRGMIGISDLLRHGQQSEALALWTSIVSPSAYYSVLPLLY